MRNIKFFIDSCDPADTQKAMGLLGVIHGQTTNPTLLTKNPDVQKYLSQGKKLKTAELGIMYKEAIQAIAAYTDGAISVEVYADWNTSSEEMLNQANDMRNWSKNVYIKFPTIPEGLKAADAFTRAGGRVNMTLVFDQEQAAAVYSATRETKDTAFVSPFVGRWDDRGFFGLDVVKNIRRMYDTFDTIQKKTQCHVEILAASIRTLDHMHGSIALGADIITAPLSVFQAWVDAGSNRTPSTPPKPANLQPVEYQELVYDDDFSTYPIDRSEHGLLHEGLLKFANDWNAVIGI